MLDFIFYYPFVAGLLCIVFYGLVRDKEIVPKPSRFTGHLVIGAVLGFGVSFILVLVLTIVSSSPQGPLALIIYAPIGISLGQIVGTIVWWMIYVRKQREKIPS